MSKLPPSSVAGRTEARTGPAEPLSVPHHPPAPLRRASDIAWRLLVVAAAVLAGAFAFTRLWIVVLPIFVAMLLASVLVPVVTRLEARRWPTLAATWLAYLGFVGGIAGIVALIVPAIADEFAGLGETLSEGVDSVERWLIEGPLDLEPQQLERYRAEAGERLGAILRSSSRGLLAGAVAAVEAVAGFFLALVLTFFFVKDGRRFQRWIVAHLPIDRAELFCALGRRGWAALSGYLRGAAIIGLLEAVIIGVTLLVVGAQLAVPVAVLTFFGAFFPLVGAVVAGIIAVLVTLVTAGAAKAVIVAIVALAVQQFDNDLLAPLIYGKAVSLHPVVVLTTITAGGALGGVLGAFLAVPLAAVAAAVGNELWVRYGDEWRSAPS